MGMAGAAAAVPWRFNLRKMMLEGARAYAVQSPILNKFVDSLPGLTAAGQNNLGQYLPLMTPDTAAFPGSDYYRMQGSQFTVQMHSQLSPTPVWGYSKGDALGDTAKRYLGGVIVASKDRPVRITMTNNLPAAHILPVDQTLPMWNGAMGAATGVNRMSVHLHGGFPPWPSDGTPFQDFGTAGNGYGFSALFPPDMVAVTPPGSYSLYWTNQQTARFLWYHDHAMHITRLNAYAGLASGYVLTDTFEQSLVNSGLLPTAARTLYLVIQDKGFNADSSLWYPSVYQADLAIPGNLPIVDGPVNNPGGPNFTFPAQPPLTFRWPWAGPPASVPPALSLVPEAAFDTILVNGCAYPYTTVQPRHYRFRILNGSQARAYNLQLYFAKSNTLADPLSGEADLTKPGPQFVQIGTEGGFLPAPTLLPAAPAAPGVTQQPIGFDVNPLSPTFGNAINYNLALAPAERADLIIDFSKVPVNSVLVLYNDAPQPWPMGDPRNDYFTGDPDNSAFGGAPTTLPGQGPNTRTLMQFRVVPLVGPPDSARLTIIPSQARFNRSNVIFPAIPPLPTAGAPVRKLTLMETFEDGVTPGVPANNGRLLQLLGGNTTDAVNPNIWGDPTLYRSYVAGRGEVVTRGSVEVWEIHNLTGDTHPIHFHLVNVQVLNRQTFDALGYLAAAAAAPPNTAVDPTPFLIGAPRAPDRNELGYKETVRMNPNEVTRVVMKFDLPTMPSNFVAANWPPLSTRLSDPMSLPGPSNPPLNGFEYVWHCHILEHEEHDMMHALVVV